MVTCERGWQGAGWVSPTGTRWVEQTMRHSDLTGGMWTRGDIALASRSIGAEMDIK